MSDWVTYEVDEQIVRITLNRPEKRNAMTYGMLDDFERAIERAGDDETVRVVIVTGSGGAFCAGTDLSELSDTAEGDRGRGDRPRREGVDAWPLLACPKPVIAAIDGYAVGMGAEFTSHADVRIASTAAKFSWNFGRRGLVPDTGAGTWLLPRLIGVSPALRLFYSGEVIDADEALRLGYVTRVVEPDDLLDAALDEARSYLATAPFATARTKELTYGGLERDLAEHLAAHREAIEACFHSEDHREGVAAFMEKRAPRFTGR